MSFNIGDKVYCIYGIFGKKLKVFGPGVYAGRITREINKEKIERHFRYRHFNLNGDYSNEDFVLLDGPIKRAVFSSDCTVLSLEEGEKLVSSNKYVVEYMETVR